MNLVQNFHKFKRYPNVTATLNYLSDLANQMGVDISDWDLQKVFPSDKDDEAESGLIHSHRDLNKIFFAKIKNTEPRKVELDPSVLLKIEKAASAFKDYQREVVNSSISQRTRQIENYHMRIRGEVLEMKRAMEAFKNLEAGITHKVSEVLQNEFYQFEDVAGGSSPYIMFKTKPAVLIYKRQDREIRLPMGEYKVRWYISDNHVELLPCKENIICQGRYSPFGGPGICWGNSVGTVERLQAEGNICEVLKHLQVLLTEYSPEAHPYVSIESFEEMGTINSTPWKAYWDKKINSQAKDLKDGTSQEEEKDSLAKASGEGLVRFYTTQQDIINAPTVRGF